MQMVSADPRPDFSLGQQIAFGYVPFMAPRTEIAPDQIRFAAGDPYNVCLLCGSCVPRKFMRLHVAWHEANQTLVQAKVD
jgi:hypothetical protein